MRWVALICFILTVLPSNFSRYGKRARLGVPAFEVVLARVSHYFNGVL